MSDVLSSDEVDTIRRCHNRIIVWQGKTQIDGHEATEDQTVFWFQVAAGSLQIGIYRTRAMIEVYKRYANVDGPKTVNILVKTPPQGTINCPSDAPDSISLNDVKTLDQGATDGTDWIQSALQEMLNLGFRALANVVQNAINAGPSVGWISSNAFYASKDQDLWVVADKADDYADIYHNDQWMGRVLPGQVLKQVATDLKPGVNFIVAKVDNTSMPPGMMSLRANFAQNGQWISQAGYHWTQDGQLLGGKVWCIVSRYVAR